MSSSIRHQHRRSEFYFFTTTLPGMLTPIVSFLAFQLLSMIFEGLRTHIHRPIRHSERVGDVGKSRGAAFVFLFVSFRISDVQYEHGNENRRAVVPAV